MHEVTGSVQLSGPRLGDVMDGESGVGWSGRREEFLHGVEAQKCVGFSQQRLDAPAGRDCQPFLSLESVGPVW